MLHTKPMVSSPQEENCNISDEALIKAFCTNPVLFEILVRRYSAKLFRAAFQVVKDAGYAEDVVQEAFTKIYRHADSFSGDTGTFNSWAYAITINCAKTYWRQLKRNRWSEHVTSLEETGYDYVDEKASMVITVANDHEQALEIYEMRGKIERGLKKIPRHLRSVLEKYYLEGKSYKEICQEEGIPSSTLKMRLFRARNYLRDHTERLKKEQAEIL